MPCFFMGKNSATVCPEPLSWPLASLFYPLDWEKTLFSELLNHRGGADPQHPGCVAYPAAVEAHVDHLLFDLERPTLVRGVKPEGGLRAGRILAALVFFSTV